MALALARAQRRPRVLFVGGSLNQTTIVHRVAQALPEVDAFFTPFYADGPLGLAADRGLLDFTVLAGRPRQATLRFFAEQEVAVDEGGRRGGYDLAVVATDIFLPMNLRRTRLVLVQEGMMDPEDWRYRLVRGLRLPRYLANTATTGLSHSYEVFCVASAGWRDLFHRGYVMAATSCLRETWKPEDRTGFLRE